MRPLSTAVYVDVEVNLNAVVFRYIKNVKLSLF